MAKFATIKPYDIANGPGVRVSIFFSGCSHHCKGCFNEELWDFNYGKDFTEKTVAEIINLLKPDYIQGLTILGGDPLCGEDNRVATHSLCHMVKSVYPNKDIWLYTGYRFDEVETLPAMEHIDVVVDGKFVETLKDISLRFKGSRNQRIIDVKTKEVIG